MSEYDSLFSWAQPVGLAQQKAAELANKVEIKQIVLEEKRADPFSALRKAQAAFAEQERQQIMAALRTPAQLEQDMRLGMTNMVDALGTGASALLTESSPVGRAAVTAFQGAVDGNLIPVPGQQVEQATAADLLRDMYQRSLEREALKSEVSRLNTADVNARIEQDALRNLATAQRQEAEGIPSVIAQTGRVARNAVDSFVETVSNPDVLFDEATASLPTLLVGPVAGRAAASAGAVEALAGAGARRAGLGVATAELREEARRALTTAGMMAGTGLTEGLSGYGDAAGEILNTPIEVLAQRFPEFRANLEAGASPDEAREALAQQVGLPAGALTAVGTGLAARLSSRFNTNPLGGGVAGDSVADVGREIVEEGIQSGISPLASNVAQVAAGGEGVDLAEGVGEQAGRGAAAGGALAAGMQTPGVVAATTAATAKAAAEVIPAALAPVGEALRTRAEAKRAAEQEQVKAQEAAATEARKTTLAEVDTAVQAAAASKTETPAANALVEPLESEPLLDPEVTAEIQGESPVTSRIQALDRTLESMREMTALPEGERDSNKALAMGLFVAKTAGQLRQRLGEIDPESAEATAIQTTLLSPEVTAYEEMIPQMFDAPVLEQLMTTLAETPDFATPKSRQAAEQVAVLAEVAPDLVSSEMARSVAAYQRLAPAQKTHLATVAAAAEIREQHQAAFQRIGEADRKTPDIVTDEVTEKGWGSKRPSLAQFQRRIMGAMARNDIATASIAMRELQNFARHYGNKTAAYDQAMLAGQANPDKKVDVNYRTLNADGKLTSMPTAWLIPSKPGSQNLVEHIFNDGNTVVELYNTLANTYGKELIDTELNQKARTPLVKSLSLPGAPKFRAAAPVEATSDQDELAKILASAQAALAEGPVEETVEEDTRTLDDALAMSEDDYLAAVNPTGKALTQEDLDQLVQVDTLDLPESAELSGTITDKNGVVLQLYRDLEGDRYVVENGKVLAAITRDGNSTLNQVLPEAQGRNIGQAAMVEYLREFPFAPSGGFSKQGAQARLRALRALKKEQAAATQPDSASDERVTRFENVPGLVQAYQLRDGAQSLLARIPNAMRTLAIALKAATAGDQKPLRSLFLAQDQKLPLTTEQVTALDNLITKIVPNVIQQLNQNLVKSIAEGKRFDPTEAEKRRQNGHEQPDDWVPRLDKNGKPRGGWLEDFVDGKQDASVAQYSAAVLEKGRDENGKPYVRYQADVAQAMALASLQWALKNVSAPINFDPEDLAAMFPDGIPPRLRDAFETMHFAVQPARTIAQDIVRMLGMQGKKDVSVTLTDGIAKSMALDVIVALHDADVLAVRQVEGTELTRDGQLKKMTFLDLKGAPGAEIMTSLRKDIGSRVLTRLLDPESQDLPTFTPVTDVPRTVSGTDQRLSTKQQEQVRKTNAAPSYRNPSLLLFADRMGDRWLQLLGKDPIDQTTLHRDHAKSVKGVNDGLEYAMERVRELDVMLSEQAIMPDEQPLYWSHYVVSNGRVMQNGFGGQGNKQAREFFSANRKTVDLSTDTAESAKDYYLSLAQALGIKTEKFKNAAAVAQIREELGSAGYQALFTDIQQMLKGEGDLDALAASIQMQMLELAKGPRKYGISEKSMHALVTHARLLEARANGTAEQFTSYLGFELDGKTNGPFNALVHFGLTSIEAVKDQLRKGGLFIDEPSPQVLSDHPNQGDLYSDVALETEARITEQMATREKGSRESFMLSAGLRMLSLAGHVALADGAFKGITRDMAKAGMVPTVYGSGARGVANQMAHDVMAGLTKYLSAVARGEAVLDPSVVKSARYMMSQRWDGLTKSFVPVNPPDFNGDLTKVKFTEQHFTALVDNLVGGQRLDKETRIPAGAAGVMREVIDDQLQPVMDTFKLVFKASRLQMFRYNQAYKAAYDAKRAELIAAGTLDKYHALSRKDEDAIRESLKHLVPAYPLMMTGGALEGEGVFAGAKDYDGKFEVTTEKDGKKTTRNYQAESLVGGMRLDLNVRRYVNPGVKAAPLLTIGAGDATMMHLLALQGLEGTLNVYDGWEVSIGSIAEKGLAANTAVLDSLMFDLLGPVAASLADVHVPGEAVNHQTLVKFLNQFEGEAFDDLAATLGIRRYEREKEMDYDARVQMAVAELVEDLNARANLIRHNKKTLFTQHKIAVDQMSGGENPATRGYVSTLSRSDLAGTAASSDGAAPVAGESAELVQRLGMDYQDGLAELDQFQLQALLATFPFTDKVRKFVVDKISHLIPDDVRVFVGTPAQIAATQAALFPGEDLGGGQVPGVTYKGVAFLTVASEETLVHELVHIATLHLTQRYFAGAKGLTAAQKDAVRELEKMIQPFLALPARNDAIRSAQMEVRLQLEAGQPALAVNEMLAWSLANSQIASQLTENEAPGVLKKIAKTIRALMRKLLGLPSNTLVETFLEQMSANFHRLARRPRLADTQSALMAFQRMAGPTNVDHGVHLESTYKQFTLLLGQLQVRTEPKLMSTAARDEQERLQLRADQELAALQDSGFNLTEREQQLFRVVQAVLASQMALDPAVLTELDKLYAHAMAHLDESVLSDVPELARDQWNALFSDSRNRRDLYGRSVLLSNFVAMGLSHEGLRRALAQLEPPKPEVRGETFDARLRDRARRAFDWISDRAMGVGNVPNQKLHLDRLAWRLSQLHTQSLQKAARSSQKPLVDRLEDKLRDGMRSLDRRAEQVANNESLNGFVRQSVQYARGLLSEDQAAANAEVTQSLANQPKVPQVLVDLVSELAGNTPSTAKLHRLVNLTRHAVSRVRQQLREEAPADVRGFFKTALSETTWAQLHRTVGQVDLQALMTMGMSGLKDVVLNAGQRQTVINALLAQLGPDQAIYEREAKVLARSLVLKDVAPRYRNAEALAALFGQGSVAAKQVKRLTPLLDRLVSLYALEHLNDAERMGLGSLLGQDPEGMQKLLNTMRTLVQAEASKSEQRQRYNRWKGWLPQSTDPRQQLVLATAKQAEDLVKRGYKFVGAYRKDSLDPSQDLAYYAVDWIGGQATFNQGALQTVEGTLSGVDALTGQSLDPGVGTLIVNEGVVSSIAGRHVAAAGDRLLTPIYNADGDVVAYERVLDPAVVAAHTGGRKDLALSIGIWLGRQAEEQLAEQMNGQVVNTLQQRWDEDRKAGRGNEYVALNLSKDPVIADTWKTIPRHTQNQLLNAFGDKVMIRRDMIRNAVGYRSASIADAFSGMSTLPGPVRQAIVDAVYLLPGVDYKKIVAAEKALQGAVGTAKDWIVVRSGVVAIANGVANMFQLAASGINPLEMPKLVARKAQELEIYYRHEKRLSRIRVELAAVRRPDERNKLLLERERLLDANSRLSIAPLIFAGELPTIAEGLSEHDEYTLAGDATKWIEKKAEQLPQGVLTALKIATISKDTALYQGLNRMVQFGDFTAKAVLYDKWIQDGMSPEVALERISERFVNYNLNAGRSRDYLESIGLLWFWNYKLRVQKIVLATLRENPLRFLLSVSGAGLAGSDSLMTSAAPFVYWDYSVGPDQLWRAPEATLWHQLFR